MTVDLVCLATLVLNADGDAGMRRAAALALAVRVLEQAQIEPGPYIEPVPPWRPGEPLIPRERT